MNVANVIVGGVEEENEEANEIGDLIDASVPNVFGFDVHWYTKLNKIQKLFFLKL